MTLGRRAAGAGLAGGLLLLTGCPPLLAPPRYITDPALAEADAGSRRGDADDRAAMRRLAAVAGFPRIEDAANPSRDAQVATAAVAVGARMNWGPGPDLDLRHAVEFVLRRRRREGFRAVALALEDPVAAHRQGALYLVGDLSVPCRPRREGEVSPCASWPERDLLIRAALRVATSDPDAHVRRLAVDTLERDLRDPRVPTTQAVVAAIDGESDKGVRKSWFHVLETRPPPAATGLAVAGRLAPEGVRVIEFLVPYLVASNRSLLEEAYRRGDSAFRRALGNAILDRGEPLPWAVTIVEQGLFDDDPDVRASFAGAVTALDPVPDALRARLESTAPTQESSRNALAFLRAKEQGRPLR